MCVCVCDLIIHEGCPSPPQSSSSSSKPGRNDLNQLLIKHSVLRLAIKEAHESVSVFLSAAVLWVTLAECVDTRANEHVDR